MRMEDMLALSDCGLVVWIRAAEDDSTASRFDVKRKRRQDLSHHRLVSSQDAKKLPFRVRGYSESRARA